MREDARYGFNVIALAVMTVVVMLLVLVPPKPCGEWSANVCAVGCRGRDIYASITGANTERAPLGLPSVWPSDGVPLTNGAEDIAAVVFTNSTDYFNYLYDGKNVGTERWNPFVAGFDFSKLAGAGVPACSNGKLTPENNMWSIAMNVRGDMADIVPILITRNIDASSLAAKVTEKDGNKSLRFDPEWETPFGNKGFVMIRKSGAIFKARAKYMSYGIVYGKETFDTSVDEYGKTDTKPLTYLTPTHAVVPGERAYAEGAARVDRQSGGFCGQVHSDFAAVPSKALPVGACVAAVYLLVAGLSGVRRYRRHLRPCLTGYALGFGLFHFAASMSWLCLLLGNANRGNLEFCWTLLVLALLAQAGGIAFVAARRRDDRAERQRGIKWMVAVPLIVVCSLLLILEVGSFVSVLFDK